MGELGMGVDNIPATGGRPVYRVRCDFTNIPASGATAAELAGDLEPRDGEEIVSLAHERCGQGEAVHSMLKSDFAAGILPSGRIGSNAALASGSGNHPERGGTVADDGDGRRVAAGGVASPCWDHLKARAAHDVVAAAGSSTSGEGSS